MESGLLVDHLLDVAAIRRASDVHIQPKEAEGEILFRIDGYLSRWMTCSHDQVREMISRLKYMAHMDIGEKRFPQDGSLLHRSSNDDLQLRLSTMPTIFGEKIVIRLFPQQRENLTLLQLGLTSQQFTLLNTMIYRPHGLLLVTGPTGSGKTTTMYKILETLVAERQGKNICSLEDPVEVQIPALTQIQIQPKQGLTFATGLRALLRQDPDIIFVGEIRDEETAEIAIRASLTGHMVFSTLHIPKPIGAVARLLEMGVKPYYLASALTGVVTQRLYRKPCPYCHDGCYACFWTGYFGRSAVFEILPVNPVLKKAIRDGAGEDELHDVARQLHVRTLEDQLLRLMAIGITTPDEYRNLMMGTDQ